MAEIINFEEAKKRKGDKPRPKKKATEDDEIKKEMMILTLELSDRIAKLMMLVHRSSSRS